jgi:hypothetical protein
MKQAILEKYLETIGSNINLRTSTIFSLFLDRDDDPKKALERIAEYKKEQTMKYEKQQEDNKEELKRFR